ncbi:MAG: O-antigen polysaccharide polymerase Wzy [Pyrinomonadaceae bacterium]|nr:O-antigen polysaccharide polymerase Wzy [Pyrinomonadaceae bacterium]
MNATGEKVFDQMRRRAGVGMPVYFGASVGALALVPLVLSGYGFSWLETFLGMALLAICMYPSARYFARAETGLPTMPVFCLAYALQFAFPVFIQENTFLLMGGEIRFLDERDVVIALLLAIAGICSLQLGYYWFQRSSYRKVVPVAHLPLKKSKALAYCVLVGIFLPLLFTFQGIIPEEFQQPLAAILRVLQNQVLVVIAILGWLYYGRKESRIYGVWLYGLLLVAAMRGISSGSLEEAVVPVGVFFVVKWLYTGRVPIAPILATAALVVFLSPVKSDYRQRAWLGEDPDLAEQSSLTRGRLWIEQATEYWADTLAGNRNLAEATSSAASRADFIHQVAYIYSMTPSVVPYQYGKTYSFFLVSFIPRIVWPDKPTSGSANSFYAVTYGVTSEEGAKTTTFGVSILGEAFMNFGWAGVVLIMLLQGILIGAMQHSFGGKVSGPGGQAVFLCFFVYFLNGIGSSAEIMFGGILQNLILGYLLLLWARQKPSKSTVTRTRTLSPAA